MPQRKTKPNPPKPEAYQVCDRCGALAPHDADVCPECGSKRFAPEWILQLRRINRSVTVQVTKPAPESASTDPRLTLYKWWPGGKQTFNINTQSQWQAISDIVNRELAPFLGWKTLEEVQADIAVADAADAEASAAAQTLISKDPKFLVELAKKLKLDGVSPEDLGQVGSALGDIAQILLGVDESYRQAIQQLVKKLPSQGEAALRQLSTLMEELTIGQITAVTSEVQRRVGFLKLFRERLLDERTYELTGDGSIHRILERAMWIVDERYWLMHSNRQLRTIVGDKMAKDDKQFAKKRPDFVCGTVDKKLIIIEIKRPSHTLTVADLNQLERYVVLCDEYDTDHRGFEAILIGTKQSDDLKRTLKLRGAGFKVRTYTALVGDSERRYKAYLDALDPAV